MRYRRSTPPVCQLCGASLGVAKAKPAEAKSGTAEPFGLSGAPAAAAPAKPCAFCGEEIAPGHRFCGNCGKPIAAGAPAAASAPAPAPAQQAKPGIKPAAKTMFFGAMQAPSPKLILIKGEGMDGVTYVLSSTEHIAGRLEGAILFPEDPLLSPRHANFIYRDGKLIVRDESSANGVFLRIIKPQTVPSGATFLVGEQLLRVDACEPETVPVPDAEGTYFYGSPKRPSRLSLTQMLAGGHEGMVFRARNDSLSIGREGNDVNFPDDPFISGRHATVTAADGQGTQLPDRRPGIEERHLPAHLRRGAGLPRRLRLHRSAAAARGDHLMATCKSCGRDNQSLYKFCLGCGGELSVGPSDSGDSSDNLRADPTPHEKRVEDVGPSLGRNGEVAEDFELRDPTRLAGRTCSPSRGWRRRCKRSPPPRPMRPRRACAPPAATWCRRSSPSAASAAGASTSRSRPRPSATPYSPTPAPSPAAARPHPPGRHRRRHPPARRGREHHRPRHRLALRRRRLPLAAPRRDGRSTPPAWWCATPASLNGIFVKLSDEEELVDGDVFRIGQELLRFDEIAPPVPLDDGTDIMGSPNPGYWGRLALIVGKDQDGSAFPLFGDSVTLGRERGDILFPEDGYVSGQHARVVLRDGTLLPRRPRQLQRHLRPRARRARRPDGGSVLMGQQLFRINY